MVDKTANHPLNIIMCIFSVFFLEELITLIHHISLQIKRVEDGA